MAGRCLGTLSGRPHLQSIQFEEIRQGDTVRIPAGQKHWHGAAPNSAMTHIAIAQEHDGKVAEWMEKVSDEQYYNTPSTSR